VVPVTQDAGLSLDNIQLNLLGEARRIIVSKDTTISLQTANGK
jgi:hypothetical protein